MRRDEAQLLSDGRSVKWTLERAYLDQPSRVRVDWLRFTVPLDAIVKRDQLLPPDTDALSLMSRPDRELIVSCRTAPGADDYTGAMHVSRSAVRTVAEMLGVFEPGETEDKGMDFYTARTGFNHHGANVGFALAGGKSAAQAGTVHVNLFGSAALHVSHEKWGVIAEWLREVGGTITRVDLALDIFEGLDLEAVVQSWHDGAFDVRGKRPKDGYNGCWASGHSRTFTAGRRETGKVCRIYEKGDELFGDEQNDPWVRVECEFRSNHRVIDLAVLTNPADYFAGASDFCAELATVHVEHCEPTRIKTLAVEASKLIALTAHAKAVRSARWFARTAAPTMARVLEFGGDLIDSIYTAECWRTPKRLVGLSFDEMKEAFGKVAEGLAPSSAPFVNGAT